MERGGGLITENEEKILVSVRLRPLNEKEISNNDVTDWECISNDTIVYKNVSLLPSGNSNAYTFDRVFRSDSSTRTVYEQGAKDAAISVVRGVNSTILAYGETNSGKTYTMTGITEYAVADIYDYIEKHPEREFVVKFSAMEIYNECVCDLLSTDNTSLKLVDDPERGTVVENLTEEILGDLDNVTELLFICQAQRQSAPIDELSPQSHQIIRLNIESSPRGWDSSATLVASVNFVDLAGSERASQSLSSATRFKQDAYMDRSLLTLGAVISNLSELDYIVSKLYSKGGNEGIPYEESHLTRILQPSLGGNARTAIICTMSPARSHVEQSRKTLEFASCAKDVATHARVNVVISDKALVKHLQKEVARLENEMKSGPSKFAWRNFSALLKEKDSQIEKLEKEIKELILQRDIFQTQVKELMKLVGDTASSITHVGVGNYPHLRVQRSPDVYIQDQDSCKMEEHPFSDIDTCDVLSRSNSGYRAVSVPFLDYAQSNASPDVVSSAPNYTESELFYGWHNADFEELCREDNCPEKEHCRQRGNSSGFSYFQKNARIPAAKVHANGNEEGFMPSYSEEDDEVKKEIPSSILPYKESRETNSEAVIKVGEPTSRILIKERDQSSIETPDSVSLQKSPFTRDQAKISLLNRSINLLRSISCNSSLMSDSSSPWFKMVEYSPEKECVSCRRKIGGSSLEKSSMKEHQSQPGNTLEMETAAPQAKPSSGEDSNSTTPNTNKEADPPIEEKNATASVQKENEEEKKEVKDIILEQAEDKVTGLTSWPVEFKRLQTEIIELWDACNVALVHRTYFFMLFQGDPTDAIYLEVEIRRMKLLKDKFSKGEKIVVDGQRLTLSSSAKALKQERKMLSEQMLKKMLEKEREKLFIEWGIGLNTKMRRLQLANLLWSKPGDINHINESAFLVAKLVGFLDPGQAPSKEVFGMNLTPKYSTGICTYKRSLGSLL